MTTERVIEAHDEVTLHTSVGVSYYLEELARRENRERTDTIVRLAWAIFALSAVVAASTVLLLIRP